MEYKGYEIKEEVLDWLIELVEKINWEPATKEQLRNEVHDIIRIGNNIGFRQSSAEIAQVRYAKQQTNKQKTV